MQASSHAHNLESFNKARAEGDKAPLDVGLGGNTAVGELQKAPAWLCTSAADQVS